MEHGDWELYAEDVGESIANHSADTLIELIFDMRVFPFDIVLKSASVGHFYTSLERAP